MNDNHVPSALKKKKIIHSPPLSSKGMFYDPQWMPGTVAYIYIYKWSPIYGVVHLKIFNFMMVRKPYTLARNCTSSTQIPFKCFSLSVQ